MSCEVCVHTTKLHLVMCGPMFEHTVRRSGLPHYITFIFRQQTHKVSIWPDITSRDKIKVMKHPKWVVSAELSEALEGIHKQLPVPPPKNTKTSLSFSGPTR